MIPNESVYTKDPVRGRRVEAGYIDSDGETFVKVVKRNKHYFYKVSGYGIQYDVYQRLLRENVKWIRIDEEDTLHRFVAPIDVWEEHGRKWTGKHGSQRVLSEKFMDDVSPDPAIYAKT